MKAEIKQKVQSCKALQGKSVIDILRLPRFRENLAAYVTAQRADRDAIKQSYEAMRKLGGAKGYKLPSHVIDRFTSLSVEQFAIEFIATLAGESKRPAAERKYIQQVGNQAYALTVAQCVVDEFPELEDELIPKSKNN